MPKRTNPPWTAQAFVNEVGPEASTNDVDGYVGG